MNPLSLYIYSWNFLVLNLVKNRRQYTMCCFPGSIVSVLVCWAGQHTAPQTVASIWHRFNAKKLSPVTVPLNIVLKLHFDSEFFILLRLTDAIIYVVVLSHDATSNQLSQAQLCCYVLYSAAMFYTLLLCSILCWKYKLPFLEVREYT